MRPEVKARGSGCFRGRYREDGNACFLFPPGGARNGKQASCWRNRGPHRPGYAGYPRSAILEATATARGPPFPRAGS
jgi:hypothetical protein